MTKGIEIYGIDISKKVFDIYNSNNGYLQFNNDEKGFKVFAGGRCQAKHNMLVGVADDELSPLCPDLLIELPRILRCGFLTIMPDVEHWPFVFLKKGFSLSGLQIGGAPASLALFFFEWRILINL